MTTDATTSSAEVAQDDPVGTPIVGGYCIKRLSDTHCVDVLTMMFNYRIVRSPRGEHESHDMIDGAWCYFGHGVDDDGRDRTMPGALLRAHAAALVWDGTGPPVGFDKEVFDCARSEKGQR
ncbi:hypothetical protein [Gordonia malaquae]|uniref:hypothetical protein n=1 Tax=Gordonia malaquae TaxID=410332 RepID=UPI00301B09EA